jgi:hypothetical protein
MRSGRTEPENAKGQCYRRWRVARSYNLTDCSAGAIQSLEDDPILNDGGDNLTRRNTTWEPLILGKLSGTNRKISILERVQAKPMVRDQKEI